jgi:hypothetical protein
LVALITSALLQQNEGFVVIDIGVVQLPLVILAVFFQQGFLAVLQPLQTLLRTHLQVVQRSQFQYGLYLAGIDLQAFLVCSDGHIIAFDLDVGSSEKEEEGSQLLGVLLIVIQLIFLL